MMHQIKLLLDQAVSLERVGDWHSAISLCEEIFSQSVRARDLESLTEAVLRMGYSYNDAGATDLASEYIELAYLLGTLHEDFAVAARALNGRAILHHQRGEIAEAEISYRAARDMAKRAKDLLTVGNTSQNLGILANIRGSLTEALDHYKHGLGCYEELEHHRGIARVLNNIGMLHTDLGQLDQAGNCLERSLTICRAVGDLVTESIVHTNRTELFLALGDTEMARESCDEAFEMSSRLGDNRIKADSLKFYGVIYRETAKPHLAEIHLRQAIAIADKYDNPLTEAESRRELALVLRAQDRNREALEALNRSHALFSTLQAAHDQADVTKRVSQLQEDFLSIVRMWGESIEEKDLYTRGHCQRVANYACRIAEEAGLSNSDLVWFRMGAFLHDVGKTEVPAEILNKPGRLTDDERHLIERHTVIGDEMLATSEFPWDIRPMVRWHHERWDGEGYPDGLKGREIPLTARILRIADVFDALTTTRSYRRPLSPQQALAMMEEDEGSFDPDLFELFKHLFEEFLLLVGGPDSYRGDRETDATLIA
jgi:putative nucleotidyltransferase with HDIG domain